MPGIDERLVGQTKELVVDSAIEAGGVTTLEVGAAAAIDQERIARENAAFNEICMMV